MRYWKFDVATLIGDKQKNERVLAAILKELAVCDKMIETPIGDTNSAEWIFIKRILELRREEFEMYNDLVVLGLNALPEIERDVLRMRLVEGKKDNTIIRELNIESTAELYKIHKMALVHFSEVVMAT